MKNSFVIFRLIATFLLMIFIAYHASVGGEGRWCVSAG